MPEARHHILAALKQRLGRARNDPERTGSLEEDLEHPRRNLVPGRAKLSGDACVRLFEEMARASLASVERISTLGDLPRAAAGYLDAQQLPRTLVISPHERLATLDWESFGVEAHRRSVRSGDTAALAPAFCGIAETGTLMFLSGPQHASASSFLPDHHLAVVATRDLVGSYEDGWNKLRACGKMPRTVNWVTGPSRSADIELTMLMGAHGPLALHVIIVEDDG